MCLATARVSMRGCDHGACTPSVANPNSCITCQIVACLAQTVQHEDYGAKRVVVDALARFSDDNVTAIVVYFKHTAA